jgi:FixJ family two-component response regulator
MAERRLVSVVDDDEFVREALPDLLRSLGLEATPFASAEEFLDSDMVGTTGCLVLDVTMPGMTGPELQIELAQRNFDIPIVFMTATFDDRLSEEVLKRGAVAFLMKPFSDAAIIDAVTSALEVG